MSNNYNSIFVYKYRLHSKFMPGANCRASRGEELRQANLFEVVIIWYVRGCGLILLGPSSTFKCYYRPGPVHSYFQPLAPPPFPGCQLGFYSLRSSCGWRRHYSSNIKIKKKIKIKFKKKI